MTTDVAAGVAAAEDLLVRASRPIGFAASVADEHYDAVWVRDAAICCLGVLATGDPAWHDVVARTLRTAAEHASPLGQLPNTVWADGWWDFGEHAAVDPTLWWCVAAAEAIAAGVPGADGLRRPLTAAVRWLRHLDVGGTGLVVQPVASDWMDSSLQRVGVSLHANALFVLAVRVAEALDLDTRPGPDGATLAANLDALLWPRVGGDPADALHFLPPDVRGRGLPHPATVAAHRSAAGPGRRHWASHLRWGHLVDVVDVLGNCLAVLAGIGGPEQHHAVLDLLAGEGVADPYPSRTLVRPVVGGGPDGMLDEAADANQGERWRNPPWQYHNAASWPMVGGFHAAALRRVGRHDEADAVLAGLVEANREGDRFTFPEWRHGRTGAAGGARDQAWSAAAVLLARGDGGGASGTPAR